MGSLSASPVAPFGDHKGCSMDRPSSGAREGLAKSCSRVIAFPSGCSPWLQSSALSRDSASRAGKDCLALLARRLAQKRSATRLVTGLATSLTPQVIQDSCKHVWLLHERRSWGWPTFRAPAHLRLRSQGAPRARRRNGQSEQKAGLRCVSTRPSMEERGVQHPQHRAAATHHPPIRLGCSLISPSSRRCYDEFVMGEGSRQWSGPSPSCLRRTSLRRRVTRLRPSAAVHRRKTAKLEGKWGIPTCHPGLLLGVSPCYLLCEADWCLRIAVTKMPHVLTRYLSR